MKHPIKTLEPNTEGRDFVIGDLHGALPCLLTLLEGVNFDKDKDRLISVGDLVDRGPASQECLELLYEPWFHCVLANHEQMMLEAFRGGYMGQFWLRNGGMWGAEALNTWRANQKHYTNELDRPRPPSDAEHRLFDLLDVVEELPFVITVKLVDGRRVHVLHAELPPGHDITDETMADPEKVLAYASEQSSDGDFLVWGRYLYYPFYDMDISNADKVVRTVAYHLRRGTIFNDRLSHVLSGHTILRRPMTIIGQTNLDTCAQLSCKPDAPKWAALTAVELGTWTFYQATPTEFREVEPVVVNRADIDNLKAANGQATEGGGA